MSAVVGGVRGFFTFRLEAGEAVVDDSFNAQVMSLSPYELEACVRWLVQADALDAGDAESVQRLRRERNRVAHEIGSVVLDPSFALDTNALVDAQRVLKRLAVFFGGIEVAIDPQYDDPDVEVDIEGIESGLSVLYGHLLNAFFDEHDAPAAVP